MTTIIIEDSSPQAKEFVAYACKSAVVQSYPLVLSLHIAKKDWTEIVNKQLIIRNSTQSAKKRILTEKYVYLRVSGNVERQYSETMPDNTVKEGINNK